MEGDYQDYLRNIGVLHRAKYRVFENYPNEWDKLCGLARLQVVLRFEWELNP